MNKRIYLALATIITFALGIMVLTYTPKPSHAEIITSNDPCGHLSVWINENPNTCTSNKVQSNMTSYGASLGLQYKTNNVGTITLTGIGQSHFCDSRNRLQGSNAGCYDHPSGGFQQLTINFGETKYVSAPTLSPANFGFTNQACGYYQDDFAFTYSDPSTHATCSIGAVSNPANNAGAASFCNAGRDCVPQPTPTPKPTATPTPFLTSTPTPTPTVTNTPTPTPTGTLTPTPTATPTTTPIPTIITKIVCSNVSNGNNSGDNNGTNNGTNNGNQNQTINGDTNNSNTITNNNGNCNKITLISYNPATPTPTPVTTVAAPSTTTSLPSTGTPWEDLATIGFAPLGYAVRKLAQKFLA